MQRTTYIQASGIDGIVITFKPQADKVTRFELQQGPRVDDTRP